MGRSNRYQRHRLADRADLITEGPGHLGRGLGYPALDLGELVIGQRVQGVGRRDCNQFGVGGMRHWTPRQLRRPCSASRIRDLMVARFVDRRSDTWT
jgi:hypothetical protein